MSFLTDVHVAQGGAAAPHRPLRSDWRRLALSHAAVAAVPRTASPLGRATPVVSSRTRRVGAALGLLTLLALTLTLIGPFTVRAPNTLRLRVIAASNAPGDQARKLAVRDKIVALLAPLLANKGSVASARTLVSTRLNEVRNVARSAAGAGTPVTVRLGPDPFPARRLGLVRFPAGSYETLVVTLGAGRGHNWWTVLFPPFAFVSLGSRVAVVGPASGPDPLVAPGQDGPGGGVIFVAAGDAAAAPVEVRFALWDLWQRLMRHTGWLAARASAVGSTDGARQ